MLSWSLESCCVIAFDMAGDAAEISQRLLSQMWVLIKARLDTSLSLIKLSLTTYQETRHYGEKESRRISPMVMWGPRGGTRDKRRLRELDRAGQ